MRSLRWTTLGALIVIGLPAMAFAASEPRIRHLSFKDGHATVTGRIKGDADVDYRFSGAAGETAAIALTTNHRANYFNLMAPGETQTAFFVGSTSGDHYDGVLPTSGDYTVRVYLMRSAARRREAANYRLTISLGQHGAAPVGGADYADGLTGGPDYWRVAGAAIILRETPAPRGKRLGALARGAVLRNLGCKNMRGDRWCQVEQSGPPSLRGWVLGNSLRESEAPR